MPRTEDAADKCDINTTLCENCCKTLQKALVCARCKTAAYLCSKDCQPVPQHTNANASTSLSLPCPHPFSLLQPDQGVDGRRASARPLAPARQRSRRLTRCACWRYSAGPGDCKGGGRAYRNLGRGHMYLHEYDKGVAYLEAQHGLAMSLKLALMQCCSPTQRSTCVSPSPFTSEQLARALARCPGRSRNCYWC